MDTGSPFCDFAYTGTDCGYNVDLATGELAHLFYSTLGNIGVYDASGRPTECATTTPTNCLVNIGPFSNLQSTMYWYGMRGPLLGAPGSEFFGGWAFGFNSGLQHSNVLGWTEAWPVASGDPLAPVPIPATAWLVGGTLGLLGVLRRRLPADPSLT